LFEDLNRGGAAAKGGGVADEKDGSIINLKNTIF
jgi:hypothetical protein